jgi:L-asparaginase
MNTPVQVQSGKLPLKVLVHSTLVLAHGGAGPQDPKGERFIAAQRTLDSIVKQSSNQLTAQETVLIVAKGLEADSQFNAGFGASIQADGVVRVSAAFMDSEKQRFSAVMNAENVLHPSLLAKHLQDRRYSILDSHGAKQLAAQLALPVVNLIAPQRFKRWIQYKREAINPSGKTGTIGCVAVDEGGHLAVLTSTGGVGNETPGRVGDTPTIAGNYCTNHVAVSCTGIGEQIISHALAPRVAIYFERDRDLGKALKVALEEGLNKNFQFAAIAVAVESDQVHWAAGSLSSQLLWSLSPPHVSK